MTEEEFPLFEVQLTMLAALIPKPEVKVDQIAAIYFQKLRALSLQEVAAVFSQALDQCDFFPTIAKLRQLGNVDVREQGIRAAEEYKAYMAAAKQLPQRTPETDDVGLKAIHHILEMLDAKMGMEREDLHPVYQRPNPMSTDDRKALLLRQAQQVMGLLPMDEEPEADPPIYH
jgi:hypothetical protein